MLTRGPLRSVPAILAALVFALPAAAVAAPSVTGEFDVPSQPGKLTTGPDGKIWVLLPQTGDLVSITPQGVVSAPYVLGLNNPKGITTGPGGDLWVTEINGVVRIPAGNPLDRQEFTISAIGGAEEITPGPDGNLWTASGSKVFRIPPADPLSFTTFTPGISAARGIASAGGLLWLVDSAGHQVFSLTPSGTATSFDVGGMPQEIAAGAGREVAYSNPGGDTYTVGRLVAGGPPRPTPVAAASDPFGIAFGPDGAYWFAEFGAHKVGRLGADGTYTELTGLSAFSGPRWIASGPGNTLWVSLEAANKVARISGVDPPPAPPPPPGPVVDSSAPVLSAVRLSRSAFRLGAGAPARIGARGPVRREADADAQRGGHRTALGPGASTG